MKYCSRIWRHSQIQQCKAFNHSLPRAQWGHHLNPLGNEFSQTGAKQGRPHGHGHHKQQDQGSRHDN